MAIDTAAKRFSALNIASPWRGANVIPDVTFPQGERQAADYMYSGIAAGPEPTPAATNLRLYNRHRRYNVSRKGTR